MIATASSCGAACGSNHHGVSSWCYAALASTSAMRVIHGADTNKLLSVHTLLMLCATIVDTSECRF